MKYTPRAIPDERTIQIIFGQAMNLAMESCGKIESLTPEWIKEIENRQTHFFNLLMLPYKPLLEARKEVEDAMNGKARTKEIREIKGDEEINYEKNND